MNENIFATDIPIYKIGDKSYITSAHYSYYDNKINLIIYSETYKIIFTKCIVYYKNINDKCDAVMKYEGSANYYRIELSTRFKQPPLLLKLNNINIEFNALKRSDSNTFLVCIPVVWNLKRPLMLIQLIESYIKYGVEKIIVNYYSSSKEVIKVLNHYRKLGIIDVYKYNDYNDHYFINLENDNNSIYHLQMWKINHCFYEYKTPSNHILFLDVDEILFTVNHINYHQLFNSLPKMDLYMLNQFFYKIESNINEKEDRVVILSDVDIYSIHNYCITLNGFTHKYVIYNTSKFYKAQVHEGLNKESIEQQYIPNNKAYIRHTRHYNKSVKDRCDENMLVDNSTIYHKQMQDESLKTYKQIIGHKYTY